MTENLLTPKQLAELLQVSVRTVYDHAARLGGFYPFGIRCLRFDRGDIDERMERQRQGLLVVQLPAPRKETYGERLSEPQGIGKRKIGSTEKGKVFIPDTSNDEFGLFRGLRALPGSRQKKVHS